MIKVFPSTNQNQVEIREKKVNNKTWLDLTTIKTCCIFNDNNNFCTNPSRENICIEKEVIICWQNTQTFFRNVNWKERVSVRSIQFSFSFECVNIRVAATYPNKTNRIKFVFLMEQELLLLLPSLLLLLLLVCTQVWSLLFRSKNADIFTLDGWVQKLLLLKMQQVLIVVKSSQVF